MSGGYHNSRLTQDIRRSVMWRALWKYHFRRHIAPDATVLDLGAGYADFINTVVAARRIAVDSWPGLVDHVAPGVEALVTPATDLGGISDASVDFALASNLFEHLTQYELITTLNEIARTLKDDGILMLLQPNYRYAYREYFDDYTHRTVYSHISLADLLRAQNWNVINVIPRFLPLTIKSRFPIRGWLIGAYLRSPFKPLGKQMLISAKPVR